MDYFTASLMSFIDQQPASGVSHEDPYGNDFDNGPHSESANQIPQTSLGCQLCNEDHHSVLAVLFSFSLQEWLQSKSLVVLLSLSTQEEMYRF